MRVTTAAACLALLPLVGQVCGQEATPRQQVEIQCRFFTRNMDTGKVEVCEPSVTTFVGRPGCFLMGGDEDFGVRLTLLIDEVKDGKPHLDAEVEISESVWGLRLATRRRMAATAPFGQPFEIKGRGSGKDYRIQMRVRESADDTDDSVESRGKHSHE